MLETTCDVLDKDALLLFVVIFVVAKGRKIRWRLRNFENGRRRDSLAWWHVTFYITGVGIFLSMTSKVNNSNSFIVTSYKPIQEIVF